MQQDNNYMENKFRQLENQQLPDLSNMDKHWQEMQRMLTNGATEKSTAGKSIIRLPFRKFFLAASVLALVFAAWYFRNNIFNAESAQPAITPVAVTTQEPKQNISPVQQTTVQDENKSTAVANNTQKKHTASLPALSLVDNNHAKSSDITDASKLTALASPEEDALKAELIIASFYGKLQKNIQQFEVNAETGGSMKGQEGTQVAVPASAFVDADGKIVTGTVTINMEEYYKYSDIIAANLTTTSGGKQLISGGMLKITAYANGHEVQLRNNRQINLIMPAEEGKYDAGMKLFTLNETGAVDQSSATMRASYAAMRNNIDWQFSSNQQAMPVFDGKTNFPDKLDQPYNVIKTLRKRIGKFALSDKSSLTPEKMKAMLQEKYGDYYDVIKVKRESASREKASNFFHRGTLEIENVVGDSLKLTLQQALRQKYIEKKDSAFFAERIKEDSARFMDEFAKTKKNYLFAVNKTGWINCDKFAQHNNSTNLVINLPAGVKSDKFVTRLVFMSTRSVLPGRTINNQIGFFDVPADLDAYVVGIGEKNGKIVSFMQKLKVGGPEVNIDDVHETTPGEFRKQLTELDSN